MEDGNSNIGITTFPIQIVKKIAEHLDNHSILNLRLTCSTLKAHIDTQIGISSKLVEHPKYDYTKKGLKFIGGVAFREVTAINILGTDEGNTNGMRSYLKKKHYFDDIFHFPLSLKMMVFVGRTHVHLLHDILQKCHNLEHLYLHRGFELEGDLIPLVIKEDKKKDFEIKLNERSTWLSILSLRDDLFRQINVNMLKTIYLIFSEKPLRKIDVLNVVLLLKNIRSEVLDQIFLNLHNNTEITEMEYFNLSMIFTEFIQAHTKTLRRILFSVGPRKSNAISHSSVEDMFSSMVLATAEAQVEPITDDIEAEKGYTVDQKVQTISTLRKRLQSIGKLSKLVYLVVEVPSFIHWDFWLLFIENQALTFLLLGVSTRYRILKNCHFLKSSSNSLKRFRMNLDIVHDFDFSGIEKCTRLEEIYVFNVPTCSEFLLKGPLEANVKNIKLIPPGLKGLTLGNVVAASEDLNKMLSSQKMLDTLVFMNMFSLNPENGADCKFLKKIFRLRSLHSCLIQGMRCKTRKTYDRIFQMLDFQMNTEDRALLKQFDPVMGYGPQFNSKCLAVGYNLDIVSPEVYQRYIWTKNIVSNTNVSTYAIRFNDFDPHL